jgi:hypothetical protein
MDELMDLLVADESAAQISDRIKDVLFAKTAEKIEAIRPQIASSILDAPEENETDDETVGAYDDSDYDEE